MEIHKIINFEGRNIHYRDEGKDNPNTIVLLHGFLQSLSVWSLYTLSYMWKNRVISIDLPGHGYSDVYSDVHTMDFMANVVQAVLNDAGVEKCVIAGHSMGGYVALSFVERYPKRVKGLCLINSHGLIDSEAQRAGREEMCRQVRVNQPSFIISHITELFDDERKTLLRQEIREICDQGLEMSEAGIIAAQRGMKVRTSKMHVLRGLEIPSLFIYGKKDERIPIEVAVAHALLPKRAELVLLEDVGHMSFIEDREYIKQRLLDFTNACYKII